MAITNYRNISQMFSEGTQERLVDKGFNEELLSTSIHPAANIIPPMPEEEFLALCADIAENGLRQPIIHYDGEGLDFGVLDGRSRLMACILLHEPLVWMVNLEQDTDPVSFVLGANFARRNLPDTERTLISTDEYLGKLAGTKKQPRKYVDEKQAEDAARAGRLIEFGESYSIEGSCLDFDFEEAKALLVIQNRIKSVGR